MKNEQDTKTENGSQSDGVVVRCEKCERLEHRNKTIEKQLWYALNRLKVMNGVATDYTHEYDAKGNKVKYQI